MGDEKKDKIKVIKGGRLIDGTGSDPIGDATVVIEDSRIKAVGTDIQIPENVEIIDAVGKTIMPGLIDSHMHFTGIKTSGGMGMVTRPPELGLIKSIYDAKDLLAAGFTTAKDCGGMNGVYLKKAVAEGTLSGIPRVLAAGYTLSQTFGHGDIHYLPPECVDVRTSRHGKMSLLCDGVGECIKATRYAMREGADFIKCFTTGGVTYERDRPEDIQFNMDEIKAIVETAAQAGKFVTTHCESSPKAMKQSILGGIKTIDHAFVADDECVWLAKENGAIFVSTLIVMRLIIESGKKVMRAPWEIEKAETQVNLMAESYKRIHKAGAVLAAGTDFLGSPTTPYGKNAGELELLVNECDFTPMDAIVAATRNGSMACFMEDEIGTIEPGKLADILIIDGNPLADIKILQDLEKIKMVMLDGSIEIRR